MQTLIIDPVKTMLIQAGNFISALLGVTLILVFGWLIAKIIKELIVKALKLATLDNIAERAKISDFLAKGGIKYTLSELIGVLCYWILILIVLVVAVNAVGLTVAADLLNKIVLYIPNVIAAVFILVAAMFVATFLNTTIQTAAANAGISQSKLLGKIVETIVLILALVIALEQLNIRTTVLEFILQIILASAGLALALAFGLGCRDIAGKYVEDWVDKVKSKK